MLNFQSKIKYTKFYFYFLRKNHKKYSIKILNKFLNFNKKLDDI